MEIEDAYKKLGTDGSVALAGAAVGVVKGVATAAGLPTVANATGSVLSFCSSGPGLVSTAGTIGTFVAPVAAAAAPVVVVAGVGYGLYRLAKWLTD